MDRSSGIAVRQSVELLEKNKPLRAAWGGHGRREVRWPLTILVAANA